MSTLEELKHSYVHVKKQKNQKWFHRNLDREVFIEEWTILLSKEKNMHGCNWNTLQETETN